MYDHVRFKIILIGFAIVMFAAPCYYLFPTFATHAMSMFTGGTAASPMSYQIFAQLGIPPMQTVITLVQYSIIGFIVFGVGAIAFGIISKGQPKKKSYKLKIESTPQKNEKEDLNPEVIHLLKERLAKGEISFNEYDDLKKAVEEKI